MSSLTDAKYLGGIGSILMLLALAPQVGFILYIVGLILVVIAIKRISDVVGDQSIFNNMLLAVILTVVGGAAGVAVGFALGFQSILQILNISSLVDGLPGRLTNQQVLNLFLDLLVAILVALIIIWIFGIASGIFLRRSYSSISRKLGAGLFSTTGLLYLIGAATTIILVGFVILLVSIILQIVAFFTLPEQPPQAQTESQTV
ncbi:MAG: DUF996 domain-containing protein [Nitrososphaerota archaeon]